MRRETFLPEESLAFILGLPAIVVRCSVTRLPDVETRLLIVYKETAFHSREAVRQVMCSELENVVNGGVGASVSCRVGLLQTTDVLR